MNLLILGLSGFLTGIYGNNVTNPVFLMNTLPIRPNGNYSIGYLSPTSMGFHSVNSTGCNRISMFQFPAVSSGSAFSLSLHIIPEPMHKCSLGLTLYSFVNNTQIGAQVVSSFVHNLTEHIQIDVKDANWILVKDTQYYVVLQMIQGKNKQDHCHTRLPYSNNSSVARLYSIIIQDEKYNNTCNSSSSWNTTISTQGEFIGMSIIANTYVLKNSTSVNNTSMARKLNSTAAVNGTIVNATTINATTTSTTTTTTSKTSTPSYITLSQSLTMSKSKSISASPSSQYSNTPIPTYTLLPSPSKTSSISNSPNSSSIIIVSLLPASISNSDNLSNTSKIIIGSLVSIFIGVCSIILYIVYRRNKMEINKLINSRLPAEVKINPINPINPTNDEFITTYDGRQRRSGSFV